jgi:hypothetical protein
MTSQPPRDSQLPGGRPAHCARQLSEAGFDPLPDLPARLGTFADAYGLADPKVILPGLQRCRLDQPAQLRWRQDIATDFARTL